MHSSSFIVGVLFVGSVCPQTWTWMGGPQTAGDAGEYGTKGVPSTDNIPGERYAAFNWVDNNGDLWLFGGYGATGNCFQIRIKFVAGYNDLWKYTVSNGTWTWIAGDSGLSSALGVYGTLGTPNIANYPGARGWGSTWVDSSNNLWLFGGGGMASVGEGT